MSEEELVWLKDDLAKTEFKTLVYCHFPLDNQLMDENYYFKDRPERGSLNNKSFLRNIFQKSGKVIGVFSGHTHFFSSQVVEGITYTTIPSFSENDGKHKPKAEYGIVTLSGDTVNTEIKKASR